MLLLLAGDACLADPPAGDRAKGEEPKADGAKEVAGPPRELKFVLEDKPWIVELDEGRPNPRRSNFNRGGNAPDGDDQFVQQYRDQLAKQFPYAAVVRGFAPLLTFIDDSRESTLRPLTEYDLGWLAEFGSSAASRRLEEFAHISFNDIVSGMSFAKLHDRAIAFQYLQQFHLQQSQQLHNSGPWFQSRLIPDYDDHIHAPPGKHAAISNNFKMAFRQQAPERPWTIDFWQFSSLPETARTPLQEYAFLAGSVEEAKQLAKDFLDVYDRDFLPQAAELARSEKTKLIASRDKMAPRLAELEQQDATAQRDLSEVEELDQGAVSDLKVKRALLKVELAGVEARLTTIDAKLKKMDPRDTTGARLVELKVAADIDLASLAAQRKVLDAMIDGQRRLAELAQSRQTKLHPLQQQASQAANSIQRCDQILADLVPFQLVDDSVFIRPVKFEVPAEAE